MMIAAWKLPLYSPARKAFKYLQIIYSARNRSQKTYISANSASDSMGLSSFIFFCGVLWKTHLFCDRIRTGRSRSYKVLPVSHSTINIHSNLDPILHLFWDTATSWLKIANFPYPTLIRHPRSGFSFGSSRWIICREETKVMGLSYTEDRTIVAWVIWTLCHCVRDRRNDGQTDRQTDGFTIANTALCCNDPAKLRWHLTMLPTNGSNGLTGCRTIMNSPLVR